MGMGPRLQRQVALKLRQALGRDRKRMWWTPILKMSKTEGLSQNSVFLLHWGEE